MQITKALQTLERDTVNQIGGQRAANQSTSTQNNQHDKKLVENEAFH